MVSLCRLAPSSTPRLFSSTAVACYSSRAASTLSPPPPASRPTSPSATRPLPSKLPGADSFEAQKYASSTRKSQIVHLLTKTDWHKSREPGEDEERLVYSRQPFPSYTITWLLILSQVGFTAAVFDWMDADSRLRSLYNKARLIRDPSYIPPKLNELAVEVRIVGGALAFYLPVKIWLKWGPHTIAEITKYRPSGRVRIVRRFDVLTRWVRKKPLGWKVDYGIARQGLDPKGVDGRSPTMDIIIQNPRTSKPQTLELDMHPVSGLELALAKRRSSPTSIKKVVIDRELIRAAFMGIEDK